MLCALQLHLLYSANFVVILATLPRFVTVKESRGRSIIKVYEPSILELLKLILLHTPLTLSFLTLMHTLCFISKSSTITIFLSLNGFSATMGHQTLHGMGELILYSILGDSNTKKDCSDITLCIYMGEILPLADRVTVSVTYRSEVISLPLLIVQGKDTIFWTELAQTHMFGLVHYSFSFIWLW